MSSKVLLPDGSLPVAPFAFRSVAAGDEPARAGELRREFQARVGEIEEQYQLKMREAHAAGFQAGEAAGRSRAEAALQPLIERLARTIDEVAGMRARLRKEAEADLIKLSLAIARRVLRRELAVDPDALHGLVLAALEKLERQEICRVKVHPAQSAAVAAALAQGGGPPVEVVPDASCAPGGLVFETQRGNLDASVESQLHEIERGLADRLRKSP